MLSYAVSSIDQTVHGHTHKFATTLLCLGSSIYVVLTSLNVVNLPLPPLCLQLHSLLAGPWYHHPQAPTANKGLSPEMHGGTQQGMLHAVLLHTSAPHSVYRVWEVCQCPSICLCVCMCSEGLTNLARLSMQCLHTTVGTSLLWTPLGQTQVS